MSQITMIQGDCLDVMDQFMEGKKRIDVVITDPPYGLPDENFGIVRKAICQMQQLSKMQIIILDWRNPLTLKDNKFAELVWEYGWISGGRVKSHHFYPTHNTIHFLGEDNFRFDTKSGSIIKRRPGFSSPRQCSYAHKTGHPFEKPLKLMEYLVSRSVGQIVLDPFMGSGTTGVACTNLGRDFIGIEINKDYFQMAETRLGKID